MAFHIVAPNPALDRWITVPELTPGASHRIEAVETVPAGTGINVVRALTWWGAEATVYALAGGTAGGLLRSGLEEEGIAHVLTPIRGETRVNVRVRERSHPGRVTELNEPGPLLTEAEETAFVNAVSEGLQEGDWLVLCGSLPPQVSPALYVALMAEAGAKGCRIALDVPGDLLAVLLATSPVPPHVVTPNGEELAEWAEHHRPGRSMPREGFEWVRQGSGLRSVLQDMAALGVAHPFVTLGAAGAALWTGTAVVRTRALDRPVRDTVGCGDVFLAAVLYALEERGPVVALRLATVMAGLKAAQETARPPEWWDGETYLPEVTVEAL